MSLLRRLLQHTKSPTVLDLLTAAKENNQRLQAVPILPITKSSYKLEQEQTQIQPIQVYTYTACISPRLSKNPLTTPNALAMFTYMSEDPSSVWAFTASGTLKTTAAMAIKAYRQSRTLGSSVNSLMLVSALPINVDIAYLTHHINRS